MEISNDQKTYWKNKKNPRRDLTKINEENFNIDLKKKVDIKQPSNKKYKQLPLKPLKDNR